jgi:hypothetical protein
MEPFTKPTAGIAVEEQKDSPFARWLIAKDERFYFLFLISVIIFFGILTVISRVFVSGVIVAGVWLIFYQTIIRRK